MAWTPLDNAKSLTSGRRNCHLDQPLRSYLICTGSLVSVRHIFSLLELWSLWSHGLICQGPAALKENGWETQEVPITAKHQHSICIGHQGLFSWKLLPLEGAVSFVQNLACRVRSSILRQLELWLKFLFILKNATHRLQTEDDKMGKGCLKTIL